MKKIILSLFILFSFSFKAQNYEQVIGIKSGYPGYGSINFKTFFSPNNAADLLVGASFEELNRYVWLNCLFEFNKNIINTSGFSWYAGVGPAVGYWIRGNSGYKGKKTDPTNALIVGTTYKAWVGLNTALGIEYTLSGVPINFALEAGPAANFYIGNGFFLEPSGIVNIAFRYVLN
jgi:hypothetical protein